MRSGTNFVLNALRNHTSICVAGEILYPSLTEDWLREYGWYLFLRRKIMQDPSVILPHQQQTAFHEYICDLHHAAGRRRLLIDLKLEQVEDGVGTIRELIYQRSSSFVLLSRKNVFKQVVSEALMYKRIASGDNDVHRTYTPEALHLEITPEEIVFRIKRKIQLLGRYTDRVMATGCESLSIFYEDMLEDNGKAAFAAIQEFMGLQIEDIRSNLVKQNPLGPDHYLPNYSEVAKAVAAAGYEEMLYLPH